MAFGFESERVRLVPLDYDRHFENFYRWINDPELTETLGIGDFPVTRGAEKEWFDNMSKSTDRDAVFAIEDKEGTHLGCSGIHGIDWRNGTAITGSYIADPSHRGKGYGTEAANLRSFHAFHVLGLRMLKSTYYGGNEASAKMQAKSGYLEYGRLPEGMWKRGRYIEIVYTYLTRERWLELN